MKAEQIKLGKHYWARVNKRLTVVQVVSLQPLAVINLQTDRRQRIQISADKILTTFKSELRMEHQRIPEGETL